MACAKLWPFLINIFHWRANIYMIWIMSSSILCEMGFWHQYIFTEKLHQPWFMMTSSNGNIFRVTGPLCWEFTGHQGIPCTKASDAELWCFLSFVPWISGWVNNREAGDLRRQRAHHDVIVMLSDHVKSSSTSDVTPMQAMKWSPFGCWNDTSFLLNHKIVKIKTCMHVRKCHTP